MTRPSAQAPEGLHATVKEDVMQLRNLKIGIRAACVFALLGILVLFMGLAALYETRQMDKATDEIRSTGCPPWWP